MGALRLKMPPTKTPVPEVEVKVKVEAIKVKDTVLRTPNLILTASSL